MAATTRTRTRTRKGSRKTRRSGRGRHRMARLAVLCFAVILAAATHDDTGYGLAAALVLACIFV
jgi:hypothetical protein